MIAPPARVEAAVVSCHARRIMADNTSPPDLKSLASRLRAEAERLPPGVRADALAAAEIVHQHAHEETPDHAKMSTHLTGLARIAELAPTANALLAALSSVGL
jgi:hypothetical protein